MNKWITTFGGVPKINLRINRIRDFNAEADRLCASLEPQGFKVNRWNDGGDGDWKETNFYRHNESKINSYWLSYGYLFKPYCIIDTMTKAEYGDFILWADSSHYAISNVDSIIDKASHNNGIYL